MTSITRRKFFGKACALLGAVFMVPKLSSAKPTGILEQGDKMRAEQLRIDDLYRRGQIDGKRHAEMRVARITDVARARVV